MFHIISSKYDHNIVPKEKPSLTQMKTKERVKREASRQGTYACSFT